VPGKVFLALAAIIDLAITALLVGVSGFVFGSGPESYRGGILFTVAYIAAVIACIIAPATGFILETAAKHNAAQAVAWLPVLIALVVLVIPAL
jgi:hypothetical protein